MWSPTQTGGFPPGTPVSSHTKTTGTQTSVPTSMIDISCLTFLTLLLYKFVIKLFVFVINITTTLSRVCCLVSCKMLSYKRCFYVTGAERFSKDMKLMFGYGAPVILRICWCVISPITAFTVFLLVAVQYKDVTYEGYTYTPASVTIGYIIAIIPIIPLPICLVYSVLSTSGTLSEVQSHNSPIHFSF